MSPRSARSVAPTDQTARDTDVCASVVERCLSALTNLRTVEALAILNERTRFRFTGLYQAAPAKCSAALFDRENPALLLACRAARHDEARVLRASIVPGSCASYAEAPICLSSGIRWGTLCHFDLRPRILFPIEAVVLHEVAAVFAEWLSAEISLQSRPWSRQAGWE